jgi:hypothetical protein
MEKMSHWIVGQAVYSEVQVGRGAAAGTRHLDRRVARAFEINRSVLHHWRKEFRQGPAHAFPVTGGSARRKGGLPS